MDTSETYLNKEFLVREYIKMCEKTKEIQDLRPIGKEWQEGDCYAIFIRGSKRQYDRWVTGWAGYECDGEEGLPIRVEHAFGMDKQIWLPRQEDLQEMVRDKYVIIERWFPVEQGAPIWNVSRTADYKLSEVEGRPIRGMWFDTAEEAWLAFVMKEKYNKIWDGEDWVEEKVEAIK